MSKPPKTSESRRPGNDATVRPADVRRGGGIAPSPSEIDASDEIDDTEDSADGNYSVGYRNPPRHSQFQPGQSGNPRGRPKDAKGLKTLAREFLTGQVPMRTGSGVSRMCRIDALLHKSFEAALKGNSRALSELLKLYDAAVPSDEDPRDDSIRYLHDVMEKFMTGQYADPCEDRWLNERDESETSGRDELAPNDSPPGNGGAV